MFVEVKNKLFVWSQVVSETLLPKIIKIRWLLFKLQSKLSRMFLRQCIFRAYSRTITNLYLIDAQYCTHCMYGTFRFIEKLFTYYIKFVKFF